MLQSTQKYEEYNSKDIQRTLGIEHSLNTLAKLCHKPHSPKEVAPQILNAAFKFYNADRFGLIQVDLDLKIWTPFWRYNDSSEDKTTVLMEEFEFFQFSHQPLVLRTVEVLAGLLIHKDVFLRDLQFTQCNQLPILVLVTGADPDIAI